MKSIPTPQSPITSKDSHASPKVQTSQWGSLAPKLFVPRTGHNLRIFTPEPPRVTDIKGQALNQEEPIPII